jgi:hypothetical protein
MQRESRWTLYWQRSHMLTPLPFNARACTIRPITELSRILSYRRWELPPTLRRSLVSAESSNGRMKRSMAECSGHSNPARHTSSRFDVSPHGQCVCLANADLALIANGPYDDVMYTAPERSPRHRPDARVIWSPSLLRPAFLNSKHSSIVVEAERRLGPGSIGTPFCINTKLTQREHSLHSSTWTEPLALGRATAFGSAP